MKKKNEEELLEKECHCMCGEECTCTDDCNCECDCCEELLPPIEERLVLIGRKKDKDTKSAITKLEKRELNYSFIDLDEEVDEMFRELVKDVDVPSLLLVQTVVAGIASGLDEINEAIEGE